MKNTTKKNIHAGFSKKELLGGSVVITIVLVFAVIPFLNTGKPAAADTLQDAALLQSAALLEAQSQNTPPKPGESANYYQNDRTSSATYVPAPEGRLFKFDPNTLQEAGFIALGLRQKTARTIINYRSKGGTFRKPEDLQKIYGLREDEFERLRPYIEIISAPPRPSASSSYAPAPFTTSAASPAYERKPVLPIDINLADTSAYITLPGIGSRLATRIVSFREKLGGFYSIEQVGETYGVPPETFENIRPYLKLNDAAVKKLNVNTTPYDELNAHPYISAKLAYLINKQRKTAPITTENSLKELTDQTNDSFEKVLRYISF